MESALFIEGHPAYDTLEEYVFERLSEDDTARIEEHLLVCQECQSSLAEVDEYILLMREATAAYAASSRVQSRGERSESDPRRKAPRQKGSGSRARTRAIGYAGGALAAAGLVFLATAARRPAAPPEVTAATLTALRDGNSSTNHARADRPLDLTVDTTGLARAKSYKIEVVDARGKPVWSGVVADCDPEQAERCGPGEVSPVRIVSGLKAGIYWVRLSANGALLREFGLVTER